MSWFDCRFWARLIEGVWGFWFTLTRPLPLWIPAFAGMTVGTSGIPREHCFACSRPFRWGERGRFGCFEIIAASVGIACDSFLVSVLGLVSQRRRRRQTVGPPGSVWKICPRHRSVVTLASAVASPARRGG